MRLLTMLVEKERKRGVLLKVRARPKLDLAFPPADVASVEKTAEGYQLEATFLGLYGQASPLPTFYTEQVMDDVAGEVPIARDLLDMINHHIYMLLHECSQKYWLSYLLSQRREQGEQGKEEQQGAQGAQPGRQGAPPSQQDMPERCLGQLLCLMGLENVRLPGPLPGPLALLRYAGLFTEHARSALGLKTLLADALQVPVTVIQGRERRVTISPEQRLRLGVSNSRVGEDAVVGSEVRDNNGMFRIRLGPLDRKNFSAYLPGTQGRLLLNSLVQVYLTEPLMWDLELTLAVGEAPTVILGMEIGARIGWDSWVIPNDGAFEGSVVFPGAVSAAKQCL